MPYTKWLLLQKFFFRQRGLSKVRTVGKNYSSLNFSLIFSIFHVVVSWMKCQKNKSKENSNTKGLRNIHNKGEVKYIMEDKLNSLLPQSKDANFSSKRLKFSSLFMEAKLLRWFHILLLHQLGKIFHNRLMFQWQPSKHHNCKKRNRNIVTYYKVDRLKLCQQSF